MRIYIQKNNHCRKKNSCTPGDSSAVHRGSAALLLPGMRLGKSLRLWNPVVPCGFGFAENAGNERIAKGGTADGTTEGRAGSA
ncbi:MAG: hypothetical protein ACTTJG_05320 [Treponema sp.]